MIILKKRLSFGVALLFIGKNENERKTQMILIVCSGIPANFKLCSVYWYILFVWYSDNMLEQS